MINDKTTLLREYVSLSGQPADEMVEMLINGILNSDDEYEWSESGSKNFPYKLAKVDPFGLPKTNTAFCHNNVPYAGQYKDDALDVEGSPVGDLKTERGDMPTFRSATKLMEYIMSPADKAKLLFNHTPNSSKSAKQVLDGFSIERLIECYAEGLSDEQVCRYLKVRPGQLKSWVALSQQRMNIISRLQDIMRSQNINQVIGEALDYEVGDVFNKADAAFENLRMSAMNLRSKVALDLDGRSRTKDTSDGGSLPIVNLGLQVNVSNGGGKTSLSKVKPVLPGILSTAD